MKYTPRRPQENVNVSHSHPLRDFFVLAGGLIAIVVGTYVILGIAVDLIVPRLPQKTENLLGDAFLSNFIKIERTDQRSAAVQDLLDRVKQECVELPYRFSVHVVEDEMVNAVALPGGHILVFTGLLDKMTSENELAFVLCHEMGHFVNRDHLRRMGRMFVFMTIAAFTGASGERIGGLINQLMHVTELGFSREQERAADKYGLGVINCFYGHVAGSTDFFETLSKEENPKLLGHFFSTHPETRKRIAEMDQYGIAHGFEKRDRIPLPDVMKPNIINDKEKESGDK